MASLCGLPAELVLQIMRYLSPLDLRLVITASPGFFRYFLTARRYVLQAFSNQIRTNMFRDEYLLSRALVASRLRLLPQTNPIPGPLVKSKIEAILQSQPPSPAKWESSLPILCELYCQRQEADQLIKGYTTEAWDKISHDLRRWNIMFPISYPKFKYSFSFPLELTASEIYRLEKGFLQFDIHRHSLHHGHNKQLGTEGCYYMWEGSWGLPEESEMDKHRDWERRAFQSIFRFVFDGYRRLIHEVEDQLYGATPRFSQLERDQVWQFRNRTVHQELLYAVHLSSRGYGLLQSLQKANKIQLQQFILVSFSTISLYQANGSLYTSTPGGKQGLIASLERLSGEKGPRDEPWTRARYFWDKERINEVVNVINGDSFSNME